MDAPEGNLLEDSELFEDFADEINLLPRVSGSVSVEDLIKFGVFSEELNFHGYVGGWGRADFRSSGLDEYVVEFDLEQELIWANFGKYADCFYRKGFCRHCCRREFCRAF